MFAAIDHVAADPPGTSMSLPLDAVFQPANVKPVLTSDPTPDAVKAEPYVAEPDDGADPDVFPFPLYVTVYVFAFHFAYNVVFADNVNEPDPAV